MTTLQFADTHNLVAFLTKSAESERFEQIVDFLNASSIKYALTVNPTIYTSCIEQFWSTVKAKTVNGEVQLQALVDGKKIIITEATVRRDLQLEDANATNQKFNFYKYIFESMVKNLDNAVKFLMYPRFVQVFLNNQLEGMATHNRIYIAPSHTKKIFANMRRQGKDFSGRETPLFPTMVVQAQEEMGEGSAMPTDPHHTPIITQPSSSQPQRKQKSRRRPKEKDTEIPQSSVPSDPTNIADEAVTKEPSMQLKELMDFCTKLQQRVLDLENTKTAQAKEITSLKKRVKRLEKKGGSRTHKLKRLYKIGRSARVVSSDEASLGDQEDASKQRRKIDDIDADEDITLDSTHFDTDLDMFGVHDLDMFGVHVFDTDFDTEEPVVNASTTTSTILVSAAKDLSDVDMTLREQASSSKDKGKGIMVEEPLKMKKKDLSPLWFEHEAINYKAQFDGSKDFEDKSYCNVQELFDKAMKRVNTFVDMDTELVGGDELEQDKSKKQKLDEKVEVEVDDAKEAEELKQCLEIVPDDGDDVTIDATPLEDLEVLWRIIKARLKMTEPVNYIDTFLHLNLKTMFEHHVEDSIWKNQQGLVKELN
ncbi:hypothetical protein Tco_0735120 [Tanacetum coccineum]